MSSDVYYVGHSNDPIRRLGEHNKKHGKKYTGKHGDWVLKAAFEVSELRADAMKMEKFIKQQKSRSLIEKLIDPNFIPKGFLAQLVRVPQLRD